LAESITFDRESLREKLATLWFEQQSLSA